MRGRVYVFDRGDGCICGRLIAADKVDLGGRSVTSEGEGCGEGDAGCAADCGVSMIRYFPGRSRAEKSLRS